MHNEGPRSEIEYRLAWVRTHLKGIGALENTRRGVWTTTESGKRLEESELLPLYKQYRSRLRESRRRRNEDQVEDPESQPSTADSDAEADGWKEELLAVLLSMDPMAFEHLCKRLLRAAGFVNTAVTRQSGDGGIDGTGVYRLSLVSFPVFFQCKRYRGSVPADKVRDFRGAMAGRGDKGLLITTGSFTSEAVREATRDGAPPIDLIDGERLCQLLKDNDLGVVTDRREIEDVSIRREFFETLSG